MTEVKAEGGYIRAKIVLNDGTHILLQSSNMTFEQMRNECEKQIDKYYEEKGTKENDEIRI
jgi:hypothetical protein